MGIHHLKLCFVGMGQLFPPVSNAFLLGQSNHPRPVKDTLRDMTAWLLEQRRKDEV